MITDKHVEFARAMVELARKHGMTDLELTYRRGYNFPADGGPDQHQTVRMSWAAGRHGAEGWIKLSAESNQQVPEKAP